jgi:hypothetical protein
VLPQARNFCRVGESIRRLAGFENTAPVVEESPAGELLFEIRSVRSVAMQSF